MISSLISFMKNVLVLSLLAQMPQAHPSPEGTLEEATTPLVVDLLVPLPV